MEIPFVKFEANGNNYLLILDECVNKNLHIGRLIEKMSNKNFGIGSDGALILSNKYRPIPYVKIYNSDGSKASLCVNGLRIVSKYLFDTKYKEKQKLKIKTDSGIYETMNTLNNIIVKVKISNTFKEENYYFYGKKFHLYFLNIGNNHLYLINNGDIGYHFFKRTLGRHLCQHFNCNVGLITPNNPNSFSIITYEKGSKLTLSCGSNICGATMLLKEIDKINEDEEIEVETLGGLTTVQIIHDEVLYCGKARLVCKGTYYV
ncbi:diaminopimelate epimerase [Mycoplasmatota bacterium]|nr:diaminopimelate epimerase [Mycoplasmatota bacterium]